MNLVEKTIFGTTGHKRLEGMSTFHTKQQSTSPLFVYFDTFLLYLSDTNALNFSNSSMKTIANWVDKDHRSSTI